MAYRCPVCDHPQSDGRHLANHLAFTALIRGGDHESWLDARVSDWDSLGEAELAERVTGLVDPANDDLAGGGGAFPDSPDTPTDGSRVGATSGTGTNQRADAGGEAPVKEGRDARAVQQRTSIGEVEAAGDPELPDEAVQDVLEEARALTSERRTGQSSQTDQTDRTDRSNQSNQTDRSDQSNQTDRSDQSNQTGRSDPHDTESSPDESEEQS